MRSKTAQRRAVWLLLLAIGGLIACDGGDALLLVAQAFDPDETADLMAPGPELTPEPSPAPTAPPVCPPLAVELPELIITEIDVPLPDIEDQADNLHPFYEKLARLLRGGAVDHLRLAYYGDSNMTMDWITGEMRRVLQAKYGDAGHGFVALGRPWPWYRHMDLQHDLRGGSWKSYAVSTARVRDHFYGYAGIAAQSLHQGAVTWVATAPADAPIGRTADKFKIYYLKHPNFGGFEIKVNGESRLVVDTAADQPEAGVYAWQEPDGPQRIEFVAASNKPVRLLGAVFERDKPGFVVDSLGVGALNCYLMTLEDRELNRRMLADRGYDLVIFGTGTNMWAPKQHPLWMREVIERHREALPGASLLILSPPDYVQSRTAAKTHWRMKQCRDEKRQIARDNNTAFWDFQQAMGGDASIVRFARRGFAAKDYVHLTQPGAAYMARRLLRALFLDFQQYLAEHPTAGCTPPPAEMISAQATPVPEKTEANRQLAGSEK